MWGCIILERFGCSQKEYFHVNLPKTFDFSILWFFNMTDDMLLSHYNHLSMLITITGPLKSLCPLNYVDNIKSLHSLMLAQKHLHCY